MTIQLGLWTWKEISISKKDPNARSLLQKVGDSLELTDDTRNDMRKFVLLKIYGEKAHTCREARAEKWRKMKKKSLSRLPPDEDTLRQHFDRTNYLSYCQKHFYLEHHPSPIHRGWGNVNGKCRPIRSTVPAFDYVFEPIQSDESDDEEVEYGEDSDGDRDSD